MGYQDFLYAVEGELNKKLKEGIRASIYTAVKNNGREKKGVLIETQGYHAAPTIYLEGFYVRYQRGEPMEKLVSEILALYESMRTEEIWDGRKFENYEEIRERVVFKLIHCSKNKLLLRQVPYMEVLDLAIVFYVLLDLDKRGTASIQICNEHLEMWGISKDDLFLTSIQNVRKILPAEFFTMQHAIEQMLEVTEDDEAENLLDEVRREKRDVMYILTNPSRNYGAACMMYPHVLEMIGDILREDFYVLPSSVHEVIIVPDSKALEQEEMDEMVVEINETQVEPEEVLSDHAYFYHRKGKRLMMRKKEADIPEMGVYCTRCGKTPWEDYINYYGTSR